MTAGGDRSPGEIIIPLRGEISLRLSLSEAGGAMFPTSRLQKGFLLRHRDEELAEEGVGFGVPVLTFGAWSLFPGALDITKLHVGPVWEIDAVYTMNRVERFARRGRRAVSSRWVYHAKDHLADLHRRVPALRAVLTSASNLARRALGWQTTFEETDTTARIRVSYAVDCTSLRLRVTVHGLERDLPGMTLLAIMNEQGARAFDVYRDSSGTRLTGRSIGTWEPVGAAEAAFEDTRHGLAFSLRQAEGTRLFRGRELVGSRLSWAGFGYVLQPAPGRLSCEIALERLA